MSSFVADRPAAGARIDLIPCDAAIARIAASAPASLREVLGLDVDPDWPSDELVELLPFHAEALEMAPDLLPWGLYLIVERAHGRVIGDVGFKGPPDERGAVEIGYGVVESCRQRGLATEAVGLLVDWARRQEEVCEVRAVCLRGNLASRRVLEKSGFVVVDGDDRTLEWSLLLRNEHGRRLS